MKLVYKCGHCGRSIATELPALVGKLVDIESALDHITTGASIAGVISRKWIRHECEPGIAGIAPLVAVME